LRHVVVGLRLVIAVAGDGVGLEQACRPVEFELRLRQLRLGRRHLGAVGVGGERQLLVADQRDHLARLDAVALVHFELHDGAADAGARGHHVGRLHHGEDGLLVRHFDLPHQEAGRRRRQLGRRRGQAEEGE